MKIREEVWLSIAAGVCAFGTVVCMSLDAMVCGAVMAFFTGSACAPLFLWSLKRRALPPDINGLMLLSETVRLKMAHLELARGEVGRC